jgi:hypothetical protein
MASSRSQTKARVSFTWSVKNPMWSRSPVSITTTSAPYLARLEKWQYCDCSICSSASCHSAKASHVASLMPPSNVHLGVVASITWWMQRIWSVVGLSEMFTRTHQRYEFSQSSLRTPMKSEGSLYPNGRSTVRRVLGKYPTFWSSLWDSVGTTFLRGGAWTCFLTVSFALAI